MNMQLSCTYTKTEMPGLVVVVMGGGGGGEKKKKKEEREKRKKKKRQSEADHSLPSSANVTPPLPHTPS